MEKFGKLVQTKQKKLKPPEELYFFCKEKEKFLLRKKLLRKKYASYLDKRERFFDVVPSFNQTYIIQIALYCLLISVFFGILWEVLIKFSVEIELFLYIILVLMLIVAFILFAVMYYKNLKILFSEKRIIKFYGFFRVKKKEFLLEYLTDIKSYYSPVDKLLSHVSGNIILIFEKDNRKKCVILPKVRHADYYLYFLWQTVRKIEKNRNKKNIFWFIV